VRLISKRIFAAAVLPAASRAHERLVAARKHELFASMPGSATVVELGPGTGPNFRYFPRGIRWIGIEPNPHLNPALEEAARGFDASTLTLEAETLPIEDETADAVVCTLVLCSVKRPERVIEESLRILKPGGLFYFVEHTGARPGTALRLAQTIFDPLWSLCADGCHTARDTVRHLETAGFASLQVESFSLPLGPMAPHIAGVGRKVANSSRNGM
jgi:SAM-dependent methyltransferase